MMVRLVLGIVLVANILVLVLSSDETTQATTSSELPASTATATSDAFSSPSSEVVTTSKPKCRRVKKCPKNEEFSSCVQSLSRAQNCSEKAEPVSSPETKLDQSSCKKACVCKENYLRAENGTCIPAEQCPLTCGDNEVLDNCPSDCASDYCPTEDDSEAASCVTPDVCPPPVCKCAFNHRRTANGSCIPTRDCPPFACKTNEEFNACPPLCPTDDCSQASPTGQCPPRFGHIGIILPCNPKCRCIKDYWRLDGICVPYGQCPGVCPANERYSECLQGECKALNCTQKDQSIPCPRIDPKYCKKGCVCEEGYLRNQDGLCVLEDKCESSLTCGDNEVLDDCPSDCASDYCPTEDVSEAASCVTPDVCPPPVCKCGFNRRRASNGSCILTRDCPPFACKTNEEFNACPPLCPTDDCSQASPTGECPPQFGQILIILPCNPKCRCIKDYWRLDGICVPYGQCPGVCPANERYSGCLQGECKALNCTQKDQSIPCARIDPKYCEKGCVCEEGYLRNQDGLCVLEDKCEPTVCPAHERYSGCLQGECKALYCTQKDQSIPCPRIDPKYCKKGCVCEEGYLRNGDGVCVLEDKCEPLQPSCISANEEYVPCMQGVCRAKNCSEKGQDVPCPDIPTEQCDSGCICKEHFLRAANGTCVPEDKCEPNSCPINEEFSNCIQTVCQVQECYDRYLSKPCPDVPEGSCEKGCVCKWGYLRDLNNVCIPSDECPTNPCEHNKRPTNCTQAKCIQKCFQEKMPQSCPFVKEEDCKEGCVCQEGYLEAEDGYCVPADQCESTKCPPFEQWSFCSNAVCRAEHCSQKGLFLPCPSVSQCDPGCLCQGGYLRDESGVCVPEEECNVRNCSENEEWTACAINTYRTQNCTEKGKPFVSPIITDYSCEAACVCKENFLRNKNGDCVPEDKCEPQLTCGENEVLDDCPSTCNTDNCPQSADDEEKWCTQADPCVPACKCRFNYKRAANGTCIPTRNCPAFDCSAKPNEEYVSCPPYCPSDECGKPRLEGQCPFKIGTVLQCKPQCQCKDGYGRVNDTCVPFAECPDLCPANETYSPCMQQMCRPEKCANRHIIRGTCPPVDEASCKRGCVCEQDFYRNEEGVCVSFKECEVPDCPANEEWSTCAQATCRTQNCTEKGKPVVCPMITDDSCEEACVCKENYLRNEKGDCVPEDQCADLCPANETYSPCMQQMCRPEKCAHRHIIRGTCPPVDEATCKRGCVCEQDFYRNEEGVCVSFKECEVPDCPANEEWSTCAQATCRTQNCTEKGKPVACPMILDGFCEEACVCKENFLRNENGDCVPEDQCEPQLTCGDNEVLDDCPPTCNTDNCPLSADDEEVWCAQADPCVPACKCRFNYKRAANGTCIPTRDCPPFDCSAKPNEEYVSCPPFCPSDACGKPRLTGRCPFRIGIVLQCKPKCQCKDGYGRVNDTCVPFAECPNLCPANETYSPCVQQTCRQQNCSNRDVVMETCPTIDDGSCKRGCVCQENFYRNEEGVCISYEDCGGPMCPNAHEVYTPSFRKCPPNICNSLVARYKCAGDQKEEPACACESGYLRLNETSPCIPICECPEMKNSFDCIK